MRKGVVSRFVTLDGVMEAPHEWSFLYWGAEITKFKLDELIGSDAQLPMRPPLFGFGHFLSSVGTRGSLKIADPKRNPVSVYSGTPTTPVALPTRARGCSVFQIPFSNPRAPTFYSIYN